MACVLYVVIPCYKEEEALPETARRLKEKMSGYLAQGRISPASRVLFVNDGSTDRTWEVIRALHESDPLFAGVNLSRNRGHQNALLAGLVTAANDADVMVSMDADLQDDINAMDEMLDRYAEGYEIVYGVRRKRDTDTAFKRVTAEGFYHMMQLLGVDVVFNHADYRLMSKRAVLALQEFTEVNLFLRGIVPQIGLRWTTVEYDRSARIAGESKYPLKKMLAFAADGVTSFSVKPIRLVLWTGAIVFLISIAMLLWTLITKWLGLAATGWSSLMCSIWMIGGVQLLSIGIIGEYIGKVYAETKRRPRFIIESVLNRREE
ncbi:MAG: glycosyltransferase family 2 protein [Eubacteriales bacterium]|nr:glycosyltransferase family 2 protein [Eubacteriales bacterium]